MARSIVKLDKLAEAQEAVNAAQEAATIAAEKFAEALAVSGGLERLERIALTFHITATAHENLLRRAYEKKVSQQSLLDQAFDQFFAAAR
jgi:hypothetical protein